MGQDFRELFFIVVFFALVFAGVQWFLLRFAHWSIALVVTGLVAFFITFLYVSMKHASPNGGGHGPDMSEYVTPFLLIFVVLFGGFCLVCYVTKSQLPKMAFVLPLAFIALFALSRYVYWYVDNATFYFTLFSRCEIEVLKESGGVPMLREISFDNTSNGVSTLIEPYSNELPSPILPRSAERITFRCYSDKTGMFSHPFPFDYRVCKEKDGKRTGLLFWVRQKEVLPMKIVLQEGDKVSLYVGSSFVAQYQLKEQEPTKQRRTR